MMRERTDDSFQKDPRAQFWAQALAQSTPVCPDDLDALLVGHDPMAAVAPGAVLSPTEGLAIQPLDKPASAIPAIGVLLDDLRAPQGAEKCASLCVGLAGLAIEKSCEIVILSHQSISGFERFGFRVERIAGANAEERATSIQQLRNFWGIDVMI